MSTRSHDAILWPYASHTFPSPHLVALGASADHHGGCLVSGDVLIRGAPVLPAPRAGVGRVDRRRLLRARERLSHKSFAKMWNTNTAQDRSGQILSAWIAKEELRTLLSTVRIGGDRHLTGASAAPIPDLVLRGPRGQDRLPPGRKRPGFCRRTTGESSDAQATGAVIEDRRARNAEQSSPHRPGTLIRPVLATRPFALERADLEHELTVAQVTQNGSRLFGCGGDRDHLFHRGTGSVFG
jgi:hypothetical protein